MGGTPWRINVRKQDELIIGIGAFKNIDTNTQYIGSAFSFDNTGAFTSFQYFQKEELKELAGSIKDAKLCSQLCRPSMDYKRTKKIRNVVARIPNQKAAQLDAIALWRRTFMQI